MAQSNHVNKIQFFGVYIHGLSPFHPCLRKMPLGLVSLGKFTSRLEEVKNSYSFVQEPL